jgi:hypothetical protein
MRLSLGADIDHMRLATLIEMGEAAVVVVLHGMIRFLVHSESSFHTEWESKNRVAGIIAPWLI